MKFLTILIFCACLAYCIQSSNAAGPDIKALGRTVKEKALSGIAKVKETATSVSKFFDNALKTIDEFINKVKLAIIKTIEDITTKSVKILTEIKTTASSIANFKFMSAVCSNEKPDWLKKILDIKDEICKKEFKFTDLYTSIINKLNELKKEGSDKVREFAKEYKSKISEMNNLLQTMKISEEDIKKIHVESMQNYNNVKTGMQELCTELDKKEKDIDVESILSLAGEITDIIERFDDKADKSRRLPTNVMNLLKDIQTVTKGIGKIVSKIVTGALGAINAISSACKDTYALLKKFMDDIPNQVFGDKDEDDENMGTLQEISKVGTVIVLDLLSLLAEEAVKAGIKFVEQIIDTQKKIACSFIDSKIKAIEKVKTFTCSMIYSTPLVPSNLFEQIVKIESMLTKDITALGKLEKQQSYKDVLNNIKLDKNYQQFNNEQLGTFVRGVTYSLGLKATSYIQNRFNNRLLNVLVNQVDAAAKRCKNKITFNIDKIELQKIKIGNKKETDKQMTARISELLIKRAAQVIEGKKALEECLKDKKAKAIEKFNKIKKVAPGAPVAPVANARKPNTKKN